MFGRAAIRGMLIRWAPMLGVGLFFVNCSDQTGPEERFGHLALIPEFESSAAYIVPVDSLRITLTRSDSTTIALTASSGAITGTTVTIAGNLLDTPGSAWQVTNTTFSGTPTLPGTMATNLTFTGAAA